ncbi:MAG: hypothetical protein J7M25_06175 [Deltaproteobacteria bacterium]|nr:hypothetical protein [Deltaproteobacteria bacterium]
MFSSGRALGRQSAPGWALILAGGVAAMGWSESASAYEAFVSADLTGQGYQLRDLDGRLLNRRRVETFFQLYVYDILPEPKDPVARRKVHPQMYLSVAFRLDADLGNFSSSGKDPFLLTQDLDAGPVFQLLYGYLGVTGLMGGWLELKLGRQFRWSAMDAYQYDGIDVRIKSPYHVGINLFGGRRVDGALPIDAPIYLLDGTDTVQEPASWQPMFGVGLFSDWKYLNGRVAYRRSFSVLRNRAPTAPIYTWPDGNQPNGLLDETATAEERVTGWLSARLWNDRVTPYLGLAYSVMTDRLARTLAGVKVILGRHSISAEYARHEPDFDGNSIFNVFNVQPFSEARLWYELRIAKSWSGYARASLRLFQGGDDQGYSAAERKKVQPSPGGGLGVQYWGHSLSGRVDWYWQEGYGGRTLGVDMAWQYQILGPRLSWQGRLTVIHWADDLSEQLHGVTAGVATGALWRFHPRFSVRFIVEDNFGEFYKADVRLYAMFQMNWCSTGTCGKGWLW